MSIFFDMYASDPCKQLEPLDYYSFKRTASDHQTDWLIHFQQYDDWLLLGKNGRKQNSLHTHSILNAMYLGMSYNKSKVIGIYLKQNMNKPVRLWNILKSFTLM